MTIAVKDDVFLNAVTGAGLVAPVVSTRNTITQAEIVDGGTVVIAGLRQERFNNDERGIPWLSKVPVLGWLFKNDLTETERRELVVFLSAKVVPNRPGGRDPAGAAGCARHADPEPGPPGPSGQAPATTSKTVSAAALVPAPVSAPVVRASAPADQSGRAMMGVRAVGLGIGAGVGLVLLGVAASPALAQEYAIYFHGHADPVKASFYAEEPPWIFFKDDDSQYTFAVGCDRIQRVERGGAAIPPAPCPVERLPTTMPRVYLAIMDLEAKRLDDSIARLREQTRAYAQAVIGTFAATGEFAGDPATRAEAELARRRNLDAVAFLQSQIQDTLFDIRLTETRVGTLLDASRTYPKSERPRFYFFTK